MAKAWEEYEGATSLEETDVRDSAPMYKVEDGKTHRIGFPLVNMDKKSVVILPVKYFKDEYTKDDGKTSSRSIRAPKDPEMFKKLQEVLGDTETRWATVIIKYDTNDDGKVFKPCTGKLIGIKLAPKDVQSLKTMNNTAKLIYTDVYVTTDNPRYNSKTFNAIVKPGETVSSLWYKGKVHEQTTGDDEDDAAGGPVWERESIVEAAWELLKDVINNIAKEYSDKALKKIIAEDDEDEFEDDDMSSDEEWEEAEEPKSKKPAKKKEPAKKSKPKDEDEDEVDDFDLDEDDE